MGFPWGRTEDSGVKKKILKQVTPREGTQARRKTKALHFHPWRGTGAGKAETGPEGHEQQKVVHRRQAEERREEPGVLWNCQERGSSNKQSTDSDVAKKVKERERDEAMRRVTVFGSRSFEGQTKKMKGPQRNKDSGKPWKKKKPQQGKLDQVA